MRLPALLGTLLAVTAGASWVLVFGASRWTLVNLGAALVGGAAGWLAVAGARRSRGLGSRALALLLALGVAWVGAAVLAADPATSVIAWLRLPWTALVDGWLTILTVPLPVPDTGPFVALPTVLVVASAAVATAALASKRVVVAILATSLVWLTGLVLGSGGTAGLARTTIPFLLAIVVVLFVTAQQERRRATVAASWQVVATAVSLAVVATLVGAIGSDPIAAAAGRAPFDPRDHVDAPTSPDSFPSPLDSMGAQLNDKGDSVAFSATVDGNDGVAPSRFWQVASFDLYDGISWQLSGAAVPSAQIVPSFEVKVPSIEVTSSALGTALVAPWVPHLGPVTRLESPGLLADRETGVVVDPSATGSAATVVSSLPQPSAADLASSTGGQVQDAGQSLEVPSCFPGSWQQEVLDATAGLDYPGRADAAINWVRDLPKTAMGDRLVTNSKEAKPGHSCDRLSRMYDGKDTVVSTEQLATIAVMALRIADIPARLGYGYRVQRPEPDGSYVAHATDVVAYPEIWYDGVGWLPREVAVNEAPEVPIPLEEDPAENVQAQAGTSGEKDEPRAEDPPLAPTVDRSPWWMTVVVVGGVAAMLLMIWIGLVALWRFRRRRRRRTGADPRTRVLGAWADLLHEVPLRDVESERVSLSEGRGTSASGGRTAGETSTMLLERHPTTAADAERLAALVEEVIYSPKPIGADDAVSAWLARDGIVHTASKTRTLTTRLTRLIDPRL